MSDLKPCPFCGEKPKYCGESGVRCQSPYCPIYQVGIDNEAWNTRSTDNEVCGCLETCRNCRYKSYHGCSLGFVDFETCGKWEQCDDDFCVFAGFCEWNFAFIWQ